MSIKFIGKRSVLYTLSKIISAVLSLLSISLFTRIFDADTYGQYLLFVSYVTLICSLFFWWHRLSTYRYYHKYKDYYDSFLKTSYLSFFLIISVIIILSVNSLAMITVLSLDPPSTIIISEGFIS